MYLYKYSREDVLSIYKVTYWSRAVFVSVELFNGSISGRESRRFIYIFRQILHLLWSNAKDTLYAALMFIFGVRSWSKSRSPIQESGNS
jgi:hypothetical protein